MNSALDICKSHDGGYTVFTQSVAGWLGSGFSTKVTEVRVRRVAIHECDEAQLEIRITELKWSGRVFSTYSSFTIPAAQVDAFLKAIEKTNEKG